jgi:hypothetical protein
LYEHILITFTARSALAARLMRVEVGEAANSGDHVNRLIEYSHGGSTEGRALGLKVVKVLLEYIILAEKQLSNCFSYFHR